MLVHDALISGSLGQAIFSLDGATRILTGCDAEPRDPADNEIFWFMTASRDRRPASEPNASIALDALRDKLREQTRISKGLDDLLIGMDPDYPDDLRRRAIRRAEAALSAGESVADAIWARFLTPFQPDEWDPASAAALADAADATHCAWGYRALVDPVVRHAALIAEIVADKLGAGLEAARVREEFFRSGVLAELARRVGDSKAIRALMFERARFPRLEKADPKGKLLTALIARIVSTEKQPIAASELVAPIDPLVVALAAARADYEKNYGRRVKGSHHDLPAIDRQTEWIGRRLEAADLPGAEGGLLRLIERQGLRARPSDILKSLTSVANLARKTGYLGFAQRIFDASAALETLPDAASNCARAGLERDLGRFDKALATFDETIELFPNNVVARNARAETLRELGRYEEALAGFKAATERFPHNEVARNARAKTLRELGRFQEALDAFEETIRLFPNDAVARTARAETLRDLGRSEEALTAFSETIKLFPDNEVPRNARAETLRELGRFEEALAAFDAIIKEFPRTEVARNARGETLRDLGRFEEALDAFEETIGRFPRNQVVRNARAETLRDLGRFEDALAAFDETIDKFPRNEVARNARAETLRELGRFEDALAAFEETIGKFPRNEVVRNARAHCLIELGRYDEAEAALAEPRNRRTTRDDWIGLHIFAMGRLRRGDATGALGELERGAHGCPFADVQRAFRATVPLAQLAANRAVQAAQGAEAMLGEGGLPASLAARLRLVQVHAVAAVDQFERAEQLLTSAEIVNLAPYREKQLAMILKQRFGLAGQPMPPAKERGSLDRQLFDLEFDLLYANDNLGRRFLAIAA